MNRQTCLHHLQVEDLHAVLRSPLCVVGVTWIHPRCEQKRCWNMNPYKKWLIYRINVGIDIQAPWIIWIHMGIIYMQHSNVK